MITVRRSCPAL